MCRPDRDDRPGCAWGAVHTIDVLDDESTTVLLKAAAEGDEAAWKHLVARHSRLVWHVIWLVGARGSTAEDVYQTTWLRLLEHIDRIRDPERLGGWLARTARNEAIRQGVRSNRQRPFDPADLAAAAPAETVLGGSGRSAQDPSELATQSITLEGVWAALGQLGDDCRRLLGLLSVAPELTYREVADVLDRPIGWIGPTRRRCLDKLAAVPDVAVAIRSGGR